jgi:beta-lactamase class A
MKLILNLFAGVAAVIFVSCGSQSEKLPIESEVQIRHDYTNLRSKIDSIVRASPGRVGVALINLSTKDSFSYNGHVPFPMFSTYKFPLSLYILHLVEEGKMSLDKTVTIGEADLKQYNHGKFFEDHKGDNSVRISVDSMIWYAMEYSDNITCDQLFSLASGPAAVNDYIHKKGITEIAISNTVREMGTANLYNKNWCHPMAMTRLLQLFYDGKMVKTDLGNYLTKYMIAAPSGANRIKGLLPTGTIVAHKTVTGGTEDGITKGTNDVGIISLPGGEAIALSVYISDIAADIPAAESIIANIAIAVYNDALQKK